MAVRVTALRRHYHAPDRREYLPGQEFTVATVDEAERLARRMKAKVVGQKTPPDAPAADITALRAQYREVIGKPPFHGWGAEALREKIGTYRTTHMVAQK